MYVCMKLLNKIWPTILRTKFIFIWYLKTVKEKEYYYRMLMQNTVSILTFKMRFKPYWFHTCFKYALNALKIQHISTSEKLKPHQENNQLSKWLPINVLSTYYLFISPFHCTPLPCPFPDYPSFTCVSFAYAT